MPDYYILKAIVPTQSVPIVGYCTSKRLLILNPTTTNSKLEHNQLLNQLKHLHNLEQRPSHQSGFQPHAKLVELITISVVVQQTQPLTQCVWLNVPIIGAVE